MSAHFTASDGVDIAYQRHGAGHGALPVLLHHGLASDATSNWQGPGVIDALLAAGREVIALDARGHGRSGKPHDPARYGEPRMAQDVVELLRHLEVARVDFVGYSMGAVVGLLVASGQPVVRRLIVGGVGEGVIECGGVDTRKVGRMDIAQALLANDLADVAHPGAANFRLFADFMGNDLAALAAQAQRLHDQPIDLASIDAPTLVIAGVDDVLAVRPQRLADALADARLVLLPGDHLTVMRAPGLVPAVVDFLAGGDAHPIQQTTGTAHVSEV
jgi:pimeloyl-ACP methyl ester carboxylesterase